LELVVEGGPAACSALVRDASVRAGGIVAVARNPVESAWLKDHAAVGGVTAAIRLGRIFLEARESGSPEEAVARSLGGSVAARGRVDEVDLKTEGGFDVGRVLLSDGHELAFWNEYMLLERGGLRLNTFPDLITTFDLETGLPVNTSEIATEMRVAVVAAGRNRLILGAGLRDEGLFEPVEQAVGRPMIPYVFGGG
jgi:DUF917 family protein